MNAANLPDQLVERAFLHNDPDAYLAGVNDAVRLLSDDEAPADEAAPEVRGA